MRIIARTMMGLMLAHNIGDEVVQARWEELPGFLTERVLNSLEANVR